jgi:NADPH:quinone reductase-like Zn-dependent oxidoreductase
MKRRYKILGGLAGLVFVGLSVFAIVLSHDGACGAPPPLVAGTPTMKAAVYRCYGGPEVLAIEDVAKPVPGDDGVLIKVHAAALNPLDKHYMRGTPYIVRMGAGYGVPTDVRIGVDFAGTVEAVGKDVTRFKPGDAVFGGGDGAFAEYVIKRESESLVRKPAEVPFEQAAAVPIAAITALQALRDSGQLKSGQRVLVNGASGGVGTFAVQLAKHFGADVTGVCSTRNVDLVTSLGADHVVDYTQSDFTTGSAPYDLIVDTIGNHPLSSLRRVMTPTGTLVMIGESGMGNWFGPFGRPFKAFVVSLFVDQKLEMMLAHLNPADLAFVADLMRQGEVRSVIDRHYPLSDIRAAMTYLEDGRTRGKIVIDIAP